MSTQPLNDARILIVDDQAGNVRLLERMLHEAGYRNLVSTTDPRDVADLFTAFQPDLVLLDLRMPYIDGFGVMALLATMVPEGGFLPILVLTADITPETRRRALASGAYDFITKPFDPVEVQLRISNLLHTRSLHVRLEQHNAVLEHRVRERTHQLEEARIETLRRLALTAEFRDDVTGQHVVRVGHASALLSRHLGWSPEQADMLRHAAPLHDLGKIGIRDAILLKPAKLTAEEFAEMQRHAEMGARILAGSTVPLLRMAEEIALSHHERWDGGGYPHGLRGADIPLTARIVSVTDVFDALTHERPYKPAWPAGQALAEMTRLAGGQFDPQVLEVFLSLVDSGALDDTEHAEHAA